jgi:branched-chain amino acid aminotransferase
MAARAGEANYSAEDNLLGRIKLGNLSKKANSCSVLGAPNPLVFHYLWSGLSNIEHPASLYNDFSHPLNEIKMIKHHWVNGNLTPVGQAHLPVSDLAILRGFGIFDFFLVKEGFPIFFRDYLNRFFASADQLYLPIPFSRQEMHSAVLEVIRANGLQKGAIRLVMTGGVASDGFTPSSPNVMILAHEDHPLPGRYYQEGAALLPFEYQRDLPRVKTINYSMGIHLRRDLQRLDAFEALYHQGGKLSETFRSNIFAVLPGPILVTPGSHMLHGITRKRVLELAGSEMKVEVRDLYLDELQSAQECFITGSNKGVMPINRVGYQRIGTGHPGEVTRFFMKAFAELQRNDETFFG